MLTDNNQIFSNCFAIIYCHLIKVSSQINKCIIFEPNELTITLSTLLCYPARGRVGRRVTDCGVRGLRFKSRARFLRLEQ